MPSIIRVLDEHTINKIAAGEVIENPASVVKELAENAIDAGSDEITIEIKSGGRQLIRITDNGCGMSRDDTLLSLERHATSKLRDIQDVHELHTMGFRGEAIPSIASISKFTLITCSRETGEATLLNVEGGRILTCSDATRSAGTTIEVKSLFFNVPVRKKFQRSANYDANEIQKMITKLSLGHPHIRFVLIHNEKPVLSTPQTKKESFSEMLSERVRHTLGDQFFSKLLKVNEKNQLKLEGFIGFPSEARQNRSEQFLFINKRHVNSPSISYTIKEAYGTTIGTQRHPIFVIHLTLPTEHVDVNVHPQKREVRFQQEFALKELIFSAIERSLQCSESEHTAPTQTIEVPAWEPPPFPEIRLSEETSYAPIQVETQEPPKFVYEPTVDLTPNILATIKGYILAKTAEAQLILIDQKAASARILYEQMLQENNSDASQMLLIPHTLEVTPTEAHSILENIEELNSMGFDIQEFGKTTFVINATPTSFDEENIRQFLSTISENCESERTLKRKKQIALIASKNAKPKQLTPHEATLFLKTLYQCENPSLCPSGKKIQVMLTQELLTKLFNDTQTTFKKASVTTEKATV